MKNNKMRNIIYVIGILFLTLGISLTIQAKLGISPFDALLVGLYTNVGLTVGSWEIIIALFMICLNALLDRNRPELLGLVTAVITGVFIDMWLFLLPHFITPEHLLSKLVCFGIGLVVIGFGTALYLQTNFAPIPVDKLTLIIMDLTKKSINFARTVINLSLLILALIFQGPIGIGTVLTVCFSGIILKYFMSLTKAFVERQVTHIPDSVNEKTQRHSNSI